jgi:hypothetical protein
MAPGLLGLVTVMQDDGPLGEEEEQEPDADERADAIRVSDCVEGFGKHVEESDAEDDASGERDQGRQLTPEPERDEAADERRDDSQRSERDSDPAQWQSLQVP